MNYSEIFNSSRDSVDLIFGKYDLGIKVIVTKVEALVEIYDNLKRKYLLCFTPLKCIKKFSFSY